MRAFDACMANETDAELLELARTALARRLRGDAYEEYTEGERRFAGAPIRDLNEIIRALESRIATTSSGNRYQLVRPCDL